MAVVSTKYTLTANTAQKVSVDALRQQTVVISNNTASTTVYVGGSDVDASNKAGAALINGTAAPFSTLSFNVPRGEALYVVSSGTPVVTVTVLSTGR